MNRHWIYNADRRSTEFISGVHSFIRVAEGNKRNGFIHCPCGVSKNLMEFHSSRTIHSHLFRSGFMPNYICWTKHGESGVIMEEGEEEQEEFENDGIIAEYGALHDDTPIEEVGEEEAAQDEPADDLGDAIREAQRECDSEK